MPEIDIPINDKQPHTLSYSIKRKNKSGNYIHVIRVMKPIADANVQHDDACVDTQSLYRGHR